MLNRKQELLVLRGIPASGKSTFAYGWVSENPDWRVRVNRDDIRHQIAGKYWGLSRMQEETVSLLEESLVSTALKAGLSVVVDATHLRSSYVRRWYNVADKHDVPVSIKDADWFSLEECIHHDSKRDRVVGEAVIRDFHTRYFVKGKFPKVPEHVKAAPEGRAYVSNPTLPKAVWLDLDGTVAERVHDLAPQPVRGPFDEDRVYEDAVIEHIAELVRILHAAGYKIIVMSGRTDSCQEESERWLIDNDIPYDDIFMRRTVLDKGRKDNLVKHDLFWENVAPKYDVIFALDDRNQVVDFTRDVLKIPVLQVQPGNF